jgi:SAM-dependent methyltransferase
MLIASLQDRYHPGMQSCPDAPEPATLSRAIDAFERGLKADSALADYLRPHRERILKSLEWLAPHVRSDSRVLELGGDFFYRIFQTIYPDITGGQTTTDLRYPLNNPSEQYDVVVNTEVLEHLKDQIESDVDQFAFSCFHTLLSECYRVLKAGGIMFVSTPNASSIGILYRTLMGYPPHYYHPHVREYTVHELKRFLEEHGFTVERIETLSVYDDLPSDKCAAISKMLADNGYLLEHRGDCSFVIARK